MPVMELVRKISVASLSISVVTGFSRMERPGNTCGSFSSRCFLITPATGPSERGGVMSELPVVSRKTLVPVASAMRS
jgi:hypothetical protein